jgi:hypothetical protein
MTPAVVAAMTAAGGVLVIAIGLRLLGLARIRVANLLPAVLLTPGHRPGRGDPIAPTAASRPASLDSNPDNANKRAKERLR